MVTRAVVLRAAGRYNQHCKDLCRTENIMKLLLITASSPEIRKIRRSRFLNFQQITMPYLAALAPTSWQVEHID